MAALLVLSIVFGICHGFSSRGGGGSDFPVFGYNLCVNIVHQPTRESCIECFRDADTNWIAASQCVDTWLPQRFAECADSVRALSDEESSLSNRNGNSNSRRGNNGNGGNGNSGNRGKHKLISCLRKAVSNQKKEMKRAQTLYEKGGKFLMMVGSSNIIDNGGPAIFSCMAQELLWNTEELENDLSETSSGCFGRFQMDPVNERWHIHKEDLKRSDASRTNNAKRTETVRPFSKTSGTRSADEPSSRNIVYQYGLVGHDMPFHGVGPLAVDILKGDCVFNSMDTYDDLDSLAAAILQSRLPVAAWIFQEIINEITSINLP